MAWGDRRLPLQSTASNQFFTCTTEKIYLALGLATIIWIGGLLAILGGGSHAGSLEHPSGPHSHNADLKPRGYVQMGGSNPVHNGVADGTGSTVNTGSRGYGLDKIQSLQYDIQAGLHNLLNHGGDAYFDPPTDRYGRQHTHHSNAPSLVHKLSSTGSIPTTAGMTNPAIVILTYQRKKYLIRTLDSLMDADDVGSFALYVSQDGSTPDLSDLKAQYASKHELTLLNHPRVALMVADQSATAYLAQHYKWVLDKLFIEKGHSHVVIMEDDMIVSPDFLTLFSETAELLDTDTSLFCVSSWNDNGMSRLVGDPTRLMRTDYFPGLGWMTNAAIWRELSPQFPLDQWDHFMRLDTTYKGRDCLIPEIARNHNIGEEGTNMGHGFFEKYLAPIQFNKVAQSFRKPQLDQDGKPMLGADGQPIVSLEHMRGPTFETQIQALIDKAELLGHFADAKVQSKLSQALTLVPTIPEQDSWLILYDRADYPAIAGMFGLLPVPRASHRGLMSLRLGPHLLYLADHKICPYIPESKRFPRNPTLESIPADRAESCTKLCQRKGLVCDVRHFQYINECSALKKHFPCVKGCRGGVSGLDVPNYVDNPEKAELYGYCLTTEDVSTCEAAHWSASRLCPCVQQK